jgi:hypothetical protein
MFQKFFQLYLFLPILVLSLPPRLPRRALVTKIKKNCEHFLEGKIHILFRRALKFATKSMDSIPRPTDPNLVMERTIKRAEACAQAGNLSKALAIVSRPATFDNTDFFDNLRTLHPGNDSGENLHLHSEVIQNIQQDRSIEWNKIISTDLIRDMIKRCPPRRAPDRYGFRMREYLSLLFDDDEHVAGPFLDSVALPMIQGRLNSDPMSSGTGALVLAILGSQGTGRIDTILLPDAARQ